MTYWLNAALWGAGGAGVGYVLRDLRDALATRANGGKMASQAPDPAAPDAKARTPRGRQASKHLQTRILAVLILIAVVVSVVLDAHGSARQAALSRQQLAQAVTLHKATSCQSRLDEQFLKAIKGRAAAGDQSQDALTHLIGTIPLSAAAGKNFAAAFHTALVHYDNTIARIDKARPNLPPLPSKVCG